MHCRVQGEQETEEASTVKNHNNKECRLSISFFREHQNDRDSFYKQEEEFYIRLLDQLKYTDDFQSILSENKKQISNEKKAILVSKAAVRIFKTNFLENEEPVFNNLEIASCLTRLMKVIELTSVNELALQCFCTFMLSTAADLYDGFVTINGGGVYQIEALLQEGSNSKACKFLSDFDFSLKLQNEVQILQKLPKGFVAYFGAYELKKETVETNLVEEHPDFCKMVLVLRSMIKTYGVYLKMKPEELRQLRVWGVLQSGTQIWFLRCKAKVETDNSSDKHSILYEIEICTMLDLKTDANKICVLFCNMMEDSIVLLSILRSFIPETETPYVNSVESLQSYRTSYAIQKTKLRISDLFEFQFESLKVISSENRRLLEKFIEIFEKQFTGWRYSEVVHLHNKSAALEFAFHNWTFLFLKSNELKQLDRVTNFPTMGIIFKEDERFNAFYFKKSKKTKIITDEIGKEFDDYEDMDLEEDEKPSNQHKQSKSQNSSSNTPKQKNCESKMLTKKIPKEQTLKERLASTLQSHVSESSGSIVQDECVTDNSIYCSLYRDGQFYPNFLKISTGYSDCEAVNILRRMANKELKHKNICEIYEYKVSSPDKNGVFISTTECQKLTYYKHVVATVGFGKDKICVTDFIEWMLHDVINASLNGLQYLHENEIIHSDISIGNVLFKKYNSKGKEKYYAVISDLNDCVYFKDLKDEIFNKRSSKVFGTRGYYPYDSDDFALKPSVFSDCYGWIVVICSIVYYVLFKEFKVQNWRHMCEQFKPIFSTQNWLKIGVEQHELNLLEKFLNCLQTQLIRIVKQMDENVDAIQLQKCFNTVHSDHLTTQDLQ